MGSKLPVFERITQGELGLRSVKLTGNGDREGHKSAKPTNRQGGSRLVGDSRISR
jgi:hypothetical protein